MNSRAEVVVGARHAHGSRRQRVAHPWTWAAVGLAVVGLAVLIGGGYGAHWRWTGLSGSVTLWDWLEALALPVAVALAPLLVRHRRRLTRQHRAALTGAALGFAGLAVAAYVVPLGWTGFRGNTLWDWLELWLLPLVVAVASWQGARRLNRPQLVVATLAGAAFVGLAFAGYLIPLAWTGFTGNTAWDWVKLLLVPVLVPTVLVPVLSERVHRHLAPGTDQEATASVGADRLN
jgi:hypothetical protein